MNLFNKICISPVNISCFAAVNITTYLVLHREREQSLFIKNAVVVRKL